GWSCSGTTTVTCTRASLAVGAAPNIVITVTAPAEGGVIGNSASVSAATADPNTTNNTSGLAQTTVVPRADLSITKSGPASVNASGQFAYTLGVSNAGPSPAATGSVTDTLPAGLAFGRASETGWTCSGTATVTCTRASLGVGAASNITITVTAPSEGTTLV